MATELNDPWLTALADWTKTLYQDSTVYQTELPPDYATPSILWRVTEVQLEPVTKRTFLMKKHVVTHVINETLSEQNTRIVNLLQQLKVAKKIQIDANTNKYMTIQDLSASLEQNPITNGQINITMTRIVSDPTEEVQTMDHISSTGSLS
ncbi:hypothetical protein VQL36_11525 [Chengkuizengella sp. SCS-71B]|uniref:hypothetical protein n=1 Tax=Chengkuizengella sp. SCS-71B TaxID=3115290 RepID=UPI0032C22DDC